MISTYSELKTSIANWLHRTDLAAVIPDFITLAESRINRELALRINDVDLLLTVTPGSRFMPLPADYIAPYALYINTVTPRKKLVYKDMLDIKIGMQGWPDQWTINGANIEFDVSADSAHTFTFKYRKGFALSDSTPANWLLTNHPDIYLYGSLLEAAPYIIGDDRLGMFQNRYDLALVQIRSKENESNSIATLGSEISDMVNPNQADIYTDN